MCKSKKIHLSQEELKDLLDYNEDTGIVTWKNHKNTRFNGKEAGTFHKSDGYRVVSIRKDNKRCQYQLSRIIMKYMIGDKFDESLVVDHINRNTLDNRFINLRAATLSTNSINSNIHKNNITGTKGVGYYSRTNKYRARIYVEGKSIFLGSFTNLDDAITARKEAEIKYGHDKIIVGEAC